MRKRGYGIFIQDTWKITRKLTLDYGLRWDYQTPWHEMDNRFPNLGRTPLTLRPAACQAR
jgi:outer membrane receptor for monomeric catechols